MTDTARDPFGLLDAANRANPYPVFTRLRAEAPVYYSEGWGCWGSRPSTRPSSSAGRPR